VITNEYHPYLNDLNEPGLFIIEGVACAGEIKTCLTSTELNTAIMSCQRYKRVTPKLQRGAIVQRNKEDIARFVDHRPYFIFAFESQLTIDTIQKTLEDNFNENKIPIVEQIDAVFCLDRGTIINFGEGRGTLKYSTKTTKSVPGIVITRSGGPGMLADVMSWLSVCMTRIQLPYSPLVPYLIEDKPIKIESP